METKDLLALLNNVVEENETESLNKHDRVLLIDGLNLFFRNFAMLNFVNEDGVHVGGLGGFLRSLGTLVNRIQPTSVYVVFDGVGSTVNRKNLLPEYKSNRNLTRITNWDIFESLDDEHAAKIDQIVRLIHYLQCLPILNQNPNPRNLLVRKRNHLRHEQAISRATKRASGVQP